MSHRPVRWQAKGVREAVSMTCTLLCCGWGPVWRRTGGRWQVIGAESWVVSVLRDGYRVPFLDSLPPLARSPVSFPTYRAGSPRSLALLQEIEKVLAKGALEIVLDPGPGFYSCLFLVEKATGGWRPVIDLSPLNGFVRQTPFKMETAASVLLSVQEGDFLTSMDLKDAYFQITAHRSSRKLLRSTSDGTVFQFKVLCFGLSTAPRSLLDCLQPCRLGRTLVGFDFYGTWTTGWSLPPRKQWPGNTSGNCCGFVTLWGL